MRRVLLAVLLASGPAFGQTPDSDRGRLLFMADGCYECHGTMGQGSFAGARIAPNPPPVEVIIAYIRHPSGQMPPYASKVLGDDGVRDIRAYLATIPPPQPRTSP